jgi:threonylcarbamoyladenosine tRNA methylthiotransferase MtaB
LDRDQVKKEELRRPERRVRTVSFQTLGCKLNQYDTQLLMESFTRSPDYRVVDSAESADICVINTCTVTGKTDRQSRNLIRRAGRKKPKPLVVVTGCFAQVSPGEVASVPGVDLIVPNAERRSGFAKAFGVEIANSVRGFAGHTRAFIKVQEGCSNACSYCVVSAARGEERARPSTDIVSETRLLAERGYKEVVLTGTDLGRYADDTGRDLPALIEMLEGVDGLARIRLSSIHPDRVSEPLLECFRTSVKLCAHIHLSVQSGDDRVLMSMNRSYTGEDCVRAVKNLLRANPEMAIGADMIVGFPGEDNEAFGNSVSFVQGLDLAYLHVFPFSPRKGTRAALMKGYADPDTKKRRAAFLRNVGAQKWLDYRKKFLDRELLCLVESRTRNGRLTGLSENYIHVEFEGDDGLSNSIVPLVLKRLEGSSSYGGISPGWKSKQ